MTNHCHSERKVQLRANESQVDGRVLLKKTGLRMTVVEEGKECVGAEFISAREKK